MFQKRDTFGVTSNVSVSVFGVTVWRNCVTVRCGHAVESLSNPTEMSICVPIISAVKRPGMDIFDVRA